MFEVVVWRWRDGGSGVNGGQERELRRWERRRLGWTGGDVKMEEGRAKGMKWWLGD